MSSGVSPDSLAEGREARGGVTAKPATCNTEGRLTRPRGSTTSNRTRRMGSTVSRLWSGLSVSCNCTELLRVPRFYKARFVLTVKIKVLK